MAYTRVVIAQLNERYEKENKAFKIYKNFRPNPAVPTLAGKFYSKHDCEVSEPDPHFIEVISRYDEKVPKDKVTYPETANQEYGWYSKPLIPRGIDDRKLGLFHGHKMDPLVQLEMVIRLTNVSSKGKK